MNQVIKSRRIQKLINSKKVKNFEFINPSKLELRQLSQHFYNAVSESASYAVFNKIYEHNKNILMVFRNKITKKLLTETIDWIEVDKRLEQQRNISDTFIQKTII